MTLPAASTKPVLLISGGPSTRALWPGLAETYDLAFLYPQAGQEAAASGLPAVPLAALVDADLQEQIENSAAVLTARVVGALPQIAGRITSVYGAGVPAALNGHMPDWFAGYAHHIFLGEVGVLAELDKLAATGKRVAGCLTHEDVAPDTRALVAWSNAHGLPTIHVPHAPCHLLPGVVDIHRETRARYVAASGPLVAAFYQDCGVPADNIRLTGGPQWDELYHGAVPEKREARAVLGVPEGPCLMYQATWAQTTSLRSEFEREFERGFAAVLRAAADRGAFLMVKIHWNDGRPEREEFYAKQMEQAGVPGLVTRSHYTYLLRAADLMIAQGPSNMCMDAAILGTPSVYLQTEGFDFATSYPPRCSPEELPELVRGEIGQARELGHFIRQYNSVHPDGDAAEKVIRWVRELCGD